MNSAEWDTVGDGASFGTFMGATLALYSTDPEAYRNARVFKSSEIYDAAITGDPVPIDFLYIATANFINQSPDAHKVIDEVFPAIDFIVTADPFNTWTAQYSDLVLPTSTWLENWDISTSGTGPYIRINKPVIERVGECKSDTEIMSLLAKKMGVEDAWSKTDEEWVRTFLDSDHPAFEGCDIEEAINEGILARKDGIYDRATYPLATRSSLPPLVVWSSTPRCSTSSAPKCPLICAARPTPRTSLPTSTLSRSFSTTIALASTRSIRK